MKASTQASILWPYLLPLVQQAAGRGAGGSGAGGGATFTHTLNSTIHTGILGDSQGPQFLKLDGSRPLTGNLIVSDGITIDGVDLGVHVLNPDAHHARATGGTAISVAGQTVNLNLFPTISGLVVESNTLRIKNYLGIGRDSNGIWIKVATHSGLLFNASEQLTMGTPTGVSATSTNLVTGSTHAHAATSSSDVGTIVPNVDTLLHSTSAGGLTLRSLGVRFGDLNITDYGDLRVGNNVMWVQNLPNETSGANNSRVGIMREADPQFALDVNGPIRGTELVGKHAIQLDDLALLLHYDGGHPYQTNYAGEPNAVPQGTVPSINQAIHYRPGKFYKNAVFGNARTNLIANGSFEIDTSGWTYQGIGGIGGSFTRASIFSHYGNSSGQIAWQSGGHQVYSVPVINALPSTYSFGVWLRASQPMTIQIAIQRNGSPFTAYALAVCAVDEEWRFFSCTGTVESGVGLRALIIVPSDVPAGNSWLYVDGAQMERASSASWYIDGTLGAGHAWMTPAAPHNSMSTRSDSRVDYALKDMPRHRWSVMGYFAFPFTTAPINKGIYTLHIGAGYYVSAYVINSTIAIIINSDSGISYNSFQADLLEPGRYYHLTLVYTPGVLRLYLDGKLVGTSFVNFSANPTSVMLGVMSTGARGDVMIDDFCISRQALTANRVKAIYESDAPVFATSSVFSFRATPKGLVWADEEGLWMLDVDGNPVMGFYGGDSPTKSWGGLELARGDILFGTFGTTNGGWLNFVRDAANKPFVKLGYAGNSVMSFDAGGASLTGVLDIDAGGGIYQGNGTFANPLVGTGLKIWSDLIPNGGGARVGRIAGYAGGVLQWGADTSGKLIAGGGLVTLDANGLTMTWGVGLLNTPNKISFMQAAVEKSYIGAYQDSSATGFNYLDLVGPGGSQIRLRENKSDGGKVILMNEITNFVSDINIFGKMLLWGNRSSGPVGTYAGRFEVRVNNGFGGTTVGWVPYYNAPAP